MVTRRDYGESHVLGEAIHAWTVRSFEREIHEINSADNSIPVSALKCFFFSSGAYDIALA